VSGEEVNELNRKGYRARSAAGIASLVAAVFAVATPAVAQTAWTAADDQAYAILPDPEPGTAVTGGVMLCTEQVWTLSLAVEPGATIEGADGHAALTARGVPFSVPSAVGNGSVDLTIPYDALEPMKAGTRLQIEFAGYGSPVRFGLTGSRRALTSVEGNCTPRSLPTENMIDLIAGSPDLELGRRLRADDIRDFVISTNQLPDLRVAMLDLDGDRRLLFVEICGSSWYYGVSGCNVAGFARMADEEGGDASETDPDGLDLESWNQVFESEGVHLYTEPGQLTDGWPDLIAIPLKPGFPDKLWTWAGQRYAVEGTIQAELRSGE
jgi:hypothetical protein